MSYKLIIVESPEKAKLIATYLDSSWKTIASKGSIVDLPQKEYGLKKVDNKFQGLFVPNENSKKTIADIKELASQASEIYIATDADREGEKIAQDIVNECKIKKYHRITFSEVSKKEILTALENPREIDQSKLAEQKARRFIDRIVGYPGSEAIKQDFKIQHPQYELPNGVGRSIAPALRLLCQTEESIQDYEENPPEPKKLIRVKLEKDGIQFVAKLDREYGLDEIQQLEMDISMIRRGIPSVVDYQPSTTQRNPPEPLTASSYQYGCFYLFGISTKPAMEYAQDLFNLGQISYMRTDTPRVPMEKAIEMMHIVDKYFGDEYVADAPKLYQDKNKENAQGAHPAILPTSFDLEHSPKNILKLWKSDPMYKKLLSDEKYWKIYQFIFLRGIASQMAPARFSNAQGAITISGMRFVAKEYTRIFDGWQKLSAIIQEQSDENSEGFVKESEDLILPILELGETLHLESVFSIDAPHHRPKRYGVGRFVSTLFKMGIVRPSTMHLIVDRLLDKHYVEIEAKIVVPTKLGKKVDAWLSVELPEVNSLDNAAMFEKKLDECKTEEDADALIAEYEALTFGLLGRKGVSYRKDKNDVSQRQIVLAKKLAAETGTVLEDSFFQNGAKVTKFIADCVQDLSLGKCPACKKGRVLEKEKVYACDNYLMNCKFMLFKDSTIRFFENYGKSVDHEYAKNIIKSALNASPIMVELISSKTKKTFSAFVLIEQSKPPYWNLSLSFKDKHSSKTNKNTQNLNERGVGNTNTAPLF